MTQPPEEYPIEGTKTSRLSSSTPSTQETPKPDPDTDRFTIIGGRGGSGEGGDIVFVRKAFKAFDGHLVDSDTACAPPRPYTPRHGFYSSLTLWTQAVLWLFGVNWHNPYRDECCPDFACCSTCSTPFKERWGFIKRQLFGFKKG